MKNFLIKALVFLIKMKSYLLLINKSVLSTYVICIHIFIFFIRIVIMSETELVLKESMNIEENLDKNYS